MPDEPPDPPTGDFENPRWYTYALWFWAGVLLLLLARGCRTGGELWPG